MVPQLLDFSLCICFGTLAETLLSYLHQSYASEIIQTTIWQLRYLSSGQNSMYIYTQRPSNLNRINMEQFLKLFITCVTFFITWIRQSTISVKRLLQATCKETLKLHITARIPRKKKTLKEHQEHQGHLLLPSNYGNKSSVHPTTTAEKREYLKTHSTSVPILMTVAYPMAVPMISLHRVLSFQQGKSVTCCLQY